MQSFDLSNINSTTAFQFIGNFLYLFISSTLLGVLAGLVSAYIIKKLYFGRHSMDREVALMMLMAYFSYMLAELCNLSAILTLFFCGIVMSHYTWHNVTESLRVTTKHTFATLSFVAEIFIFPYVGMDALDIERWRFLMTSDHKARFSFIFFEIKQSCERGSSIPCSFFQSCKISKAKFVLLRLVLVGRAAFVFLLSFVAKLTKKSNYHKIDFKKELILCLHITIWWAGLMRGAVSMALTYSKFTETDAKLWKNAFMITSTITVVLFSTVVFGLMTKPLIRYLPLRA
ncbi:hypothetical protein SAY87_022292 [Trapa incisa]|uniref:Cation/H+ exchanger transmembrane domain-containing protein n=1 Tax=Trapa incisa TaxID=236973 RepID=A0AAN7K3J3_9MYRT|nr:hypothetical protein SAY87_022292 [Trapa incisa]